MNLTGITRKNAIVEYIDYQTPVTQLKGPKRDRKIHQSEIVVRHIPAISIYGYVGDRKI